MTDLLAARSQMAISLAFHIIFAAIGMAMPALMVLAEWRWQRTGDRVFLDLAKRWSAGTAIMFAVGAVSGTVLSFELGLLWPGFMERAGAIIGMPFSLEGFAFFTEAIFLGIYLYGRDRISPRAHLASAIAVAVSGLFSAIFVVIANAWMNSPTGFRMENGLAVDIDPIAAMRNPGAFSQVLHMVIAAYAATGIAVAAIHAWMLRKRPASPFHQSALRIALAIAIPAALLQPLSGDLSARYVARQQPAKLAAMEGQFRTERRAALRLGGLPDVDAQVTRYAIEIPGALSLLAFHDLDAEVAGLDRTPRGEWPPVVVVHIAFQLMVALGSYLVVVALWATWALWRSGRQLGRHPRLLLALVLGGPMGFLAIEAGWTVTEVGRQPWIIQGVMRTADAVTPMPGLWIPAVTFTLLFLFLGVVTATVLYRQIIRRPETDPRTAEHGVPS